jgi:hypothetical protein
MHRYVQRHMVLLPFWSVQNVFGPFQGLMKIEWKWHIVIEVM